MFTECLLCLISFVSMGFHSHLNTCFKIRRISLISHSQFMQKHALFFHSASVKASIPPAVSHGNVVTTMASVSLETGSLIPLL